MPGQAPKPDAGLPQVIDALRPLELAEVSASSWQKWQGLRDLSSGPPSRAQSGTPSAEDLWALARVLGAEGAGGEELWQWLAQPAAQAAECGASRARALVVVLGECVAGDQSARGISWPAGAAYLALLAIGGAERCWGTLFHPALFRHILCVLRRHLCVPPSERSKRAVTADEPVDSAGASSRSGAADTLEEASQEEVEAGAVELLSMLVALLKVRSLFASSRELTSLVVAELAAILSRPVSISVAGAAASGLAAVIAGASDQDEVRSAAAMVLRAILPALLMSQDIATLAVTPRRWELHARGAALGLARGLVEGRPGLLLPRVLCKSAVAAEEGSEVEAEEAGQKPAVDDPLIALLQLMCACALERAEWRQLTTEAVLELLTAAVVVEQDNLSARSDDFGEQAMSQALEEEVLRRGNGVVVRFTTFLERLMLSERSAHRILAAETASLMLERSSSLAASLGDAGESLRVQLDERLLASLLQRCNDTVPSVRSHALGGIGTAVGALVAYEEGKQLLADAIEGKKTACLDIPHLFKSAASDEKVLARRAALALMESSLRALQQMPLREDLASFFNHELLGRLAADTSILVRKAAIANLSLLLKLRPTLQVCELWARSVLPLALDPEGSVVEKALEEIEAAIFGPLSLASLRSQRWGAVSAGEGEQMLVPRSAGPQLPPVLRHLPAEGVEYLQRALRCFSCRQQGLKLSSLSTALAAIVRDSLPLPLAQWPQAVWPLLEELAALGTDAVQAELVLDAWEAFESSQRDMRDADQSERSRSYNILGAKILSVLEHCVSRLAPLRAQHLASQLCKGVAALALPLEQASAAMRVLEQLRAAGLAPEVANWRDSLLKAIEACLAEYAKYTALSEPASKAAKRKVVKEDRVAISNRVGPHLFLLGELALVGHDLARFPNSLISSLQGLAAGEAAARPQADEEEGSSKKRNALRAHAVAALGKLCLSQEALAKRSVELFVFFLGPAEPLSVRNIALIVLSDLCVQYTSLVDRFDSHLADLLRDPVQLLRRQAAMVLASLLSENFIKFRGGLMYRLLFALSDSSDDVRNIVECTFERILMPRQPGLFSQIFVGAMCALNGWSGHPSYQGAEGNSYFCLAADPARRTVVYRFMLGLMTREQKFNVCCQLVTGFLAAFVDVEEGQRLPLPGEEAGPGGHCLADAFALLSCKEMRVCFSPKAAGPEEEEGSSAACAEAARGVFSGVLKRVVCEKIVPVLVQLKAVMEEQRSPFLGRLRSCLCEILREFGDDEIREFLGCDEQLTEEVFFDLARAPMVSGEPSDAAGDVGAAREAASKPLLVSQVLGTSCFRKRHSLGTALMASAEAAACEEAQISVPGSARPADAPKPAESVTVGGRKRRTTSAGSQAGRKRRGTARAADVPLQRQVATPQMRPAQSKRELGLLGAAMGMRASPRPGA
eukprot:TRINITY_DN16841_c0_g1_i1.p1 TRINITY_DN16841_c0_g1~~TRINITY_DN16841_c0_g1_i1.p1  ORF type:complete len:1438 (-),score=393.32 TRINITY_DN16841_c0_g1_i1:43-4317(-)